MTTRRETILAALKATLSAVPGVTGVYRSRADAFTQGESPALNLLLDNEVPNEDTIGKINAELHVEVQVYCRGLEPDRIADPLTEAVHALVMADPTVGGLAFDVAEDGTSWDFNEADRTALMVRMRYVVRYRHDRSSLTS